jgi:purine-binding chemotaxis protein CheW
MANLAKTEVECSNTSNELIELLVSFAKNTEGKTSGARKACNIDDMENLIRVLNTPTYVEGIVNMHGKMIPIISLRK